MVIYLSFTSLLIMISGGLSHAESDHMSIMSAQYSVMTLTRSLIFYANCGDQALMVLKAT